MKRSIVSDSSPLISFARANKLSIIQSVYGEIIIPPAVYDEIVAKGEGKPGAKVVKEAGWIKVRRPQNHTKIEKLKKENFGSGESEAIALAEELEATLLADEEEVLREARKRGIRITSTHLTLEVAKMKSIIKSVKKELDELVASGFRTTQHLIRNSLQKVGEQPNS